MKVNLNIDPDLRLGDPGKIIVALFHDVSGHVLAEKEFDLKDLIADYMTAKAIALPGDTSEFYIPATARAETASMVAGFSDAARLANEMYDDLAQHNIQNIASARVL